MFRTLFHLLNSPRDEASNQDRENACVFMIIYAMMVVCQNLKDIIDLHAYDGRFTTDPAFCNTELSVIENIRHAAEHADIIFLDDGIIKMENHKKRIGTYVHRERFIDESIDVLNDIMTTLPAEKKERGTLRAILGDIQGLKQNGSVVNLTALFYSLMQAVISIDEIYIQTYKQFSFAILRVIRFKGPSIDGLILNETGMELHELRRSFAHDDYEFKGKFIVAKDRGEIKAVVDVEDLKRIINVSQILSKMPVIILCEAMIENIMTPHAFKKHVYDP